VAYLLIYQYLWFAFWIALFVKWIGSFGRSASFVPLALSLAIGIAAIEIALWVASPLEVRSGVGYLITRSVRTIFANFVLICVGCTLAAERLRLFDGDQLKDKTRALFVTSNPGWWITTLLSCAAVVGFSYLLFWLANPTQSGMLQETINDPLIVSPLIILGPLLLAAVTEELAFRFALQNWLIRILGGNCRAHIVAAVLVTVFWTIGHADAIEPNWVKFVQIASIGVLLSFLNVRYGILSCILVHLTLNSMIPLFVTLPLVVS